MSSQRKDKSDKRKSSKERSTVEFSKYQPLEESESSESEKLQPPEKKPADKPLGSSVSTNPKSKGAISKIRSSLSSTDTSYKKVVGAESKTVRRSRSSEQGGFVPIFKSAGASKAKGTSKSPFKRDSKPRSSRSESKSPTKKMQLRQTRSQKAEEKQCLLDHEDGVARVVAEMPRPPPETKRGDGPKASNKDLRVPESEVSDDESTSKSSLSETSSVSKATRDLNINPRDELKEPKKVWNLRSSASVYEELPPESPGSDKSSGDSDKEIKSKRKKK